MQPLVAIIQALYSYNTDPVAYNAAPVGDMTAPVSYITDPVTIMQHAILQPL